MSTIKPDSQMECILAMAALLASGLSLLVTVVIFSLLSPAVANSVNKVNYSPSIPPASILNWPAGTIMVIFLAVMLCMLLTIRAESTTTSRKRRLAAKVAAYIAVFLWVATFGLFFLLARDFILSPIFIVGAILSVIMGVQMLRVAIALRRQLSQTSEDAPPDDPAPGFLQREYLRINFKRLSLGVSAALFLPIFAGTVPPMLSIVLIPVTMILVLASYGYPGAAPNPVVDFTSRSLAHSLFVGHAQIVFGAFLIMVVLVTLLILVLMMIGWIVSRLRKVADSVK